MIYERRESGVLEVMATGHRPPRLGGYDESDPLNIAIKKAIFNSVKLLTQSYEKVYGISGMALGTDMWFAEAILELGLPLTCAIPHDGHSARWPKESQERHASICSRAREVVVVSPGVYASWKMAVRDKWMVDECDVALAVYNPAFTDGGTYITFTMLQRKKKPMIWINPGLQPYIENIRLGEIKP